MGIASASTNPSLRDAWLHQAHATTIADLGLTPAGSHFEVLRQDLDGSGGGRFLFEAMEPSPISASSTAVPPVRRRLRAQAVVIARPTRPWEQQDAPERGAAVCVSSQAGCPLDCQFCDTGRTKGPNLPAWTIVAQVRAAQRINPNIERVVFMGMGEPLLNYREVSSAITELQRDMVFRRPWALTVSTVGVTPKIHALATDHPEVALTVSLHAPSQELRAELLPAGAARWPLPDILQAARAHETITGRSPMFAYIVLPGINDTSAHADELAALLLRGRDPGSPRPFVNLVPYNPTQVGDALGFRTPSDARMRNLRTLLRARGVQATIRWSTAAGRPLAAACGQLTKTLAHEAAQGLDAAVGVLPPSISATGADAPSPPQLTRALYLASSAEEVLSLVDAHAASLNGIHVATALVTLARDKSGGGAAARAAAEGKPRGSFRTNNPCKDPRLHPLLESGLQQLPSEGQPRACATALWALAKLACHPGNSLLRGLTTSIALHLEDLWPQSLANCFWSLATLRYNCNIFTPALADEVQKRVAELTPVELAKTLWAMGRMRHQSKELLDELSQALHTQVSRLKPQDVSDSLVAFSRLRYHPGEAFLEELEKFVHEKAKSFKPSEMSASVKALEDVRCVPSGTLMPVGVELDL